MSLPTLVTVVTTVTAAPTSLINGEIEGRNRALYYARRVLVQAATLRNADFTGGMFDAHQSRMSGSDRIAKAEIENTGSLLLR